MTINIAKESVTGYLGLITYIATLLPNNILLLFYVWQKSHLRKWLLKHRRVIGLICFFFSFLHGILVIYRYDISLFKLDTFTRYFTGLGSISIITALTFTSNNLSIRKLGKNWKSLHQLTYVALFLLILHLLLVNQGVLAWYTWCALIILCLLVYVWLLNLLMKLSR